MRLGQLKRIPAFDKNLAREFFVYTAPLSDFIAGTQRTITVEIQGDSDFELVKMSSSTVRSLASPALLSAVLFGSTPIKILNVTSAESLFEDIDFASFNSSGKMPFIFPNPIPIEARSVLEITIDNNYVDVDYFSISLIGAKVYGKRRK